MWYGISCGILIWNVACGSSLGLLRVFLILLKMMISKRYLLANQASGTPGLICATVPPLEPEILVIGAALKSST